MLPSTAIDWLNAQMLSVETISHRLETVLCRAALMDRFRQSYPQLYRPHADGCLASESAYAEALRSFLGRLSQRFPVISDSFLDDSEWVAEYIPVAPQGENWFELSVTDFGSAYQVVLLATGNIENDITLPQPIHDIVPIEGRFDLDMDRLRRLTENYRTPLRYLYEVVSIVFHETDNYWLDNTHETLAESDGYPEWTVESLDRLESEWKRAKQSLRQFYRFEKWLDADLETRVPQVVRLLHKAAMSLVTV